jgi:GntR family transcriptional regulator of vanillate catabolism
MPSENSQTVKTLIRLRELIVNGELAPGERLLEVALVERLEASRTPIRAALIKLSEEGLIERLPGGGYMVREYTERDIADSIEVRGLIEGMAARLAAESGMRPGGLDRIKQSVAAIDCLLDNPNLTNEDIGSYLELNNQFHRQLVELADSMIIERMLEHVVTLPFAAPNAFVIANTEMTRSWIVFFVAQEQHRAIVEAIEHHEGMRAELLAREHAHLSLRTLRTAVKTKGALDTVPGIKLLSNVEN